MSDEDILQLHRESGKNSYLGELYNRYLPVIYGVCLKHLKKRFIAQEAVLQIFDNLSDKITGYEIEAFQPWIYNVAKNHCLQLLRKEEPHIQVELIDGEIGLANFSQDAIEGYDLIKNNSVKNDLEIMKKHIYRQSRKKINYRMLFGIAACILIFVFLSVYYLFFENKDMNDNLSHVEKHYNKVDTATLLLEINEISSRLKNLRKENLVVEENNETQREAGRKNNESSRSANSGDKQSNNRSGNSNYYLSNYDNSYYTNYSNYSPSNYSDNSLTNTEIQEYLAGYNRPTEGNPKPQSSDSKPVSGEKSFSEYIEKNIKELPANAFDDKHGKVILMFKVNENGRPFDIVVLRSLSQMADKEAVKLLENGPDWTLSNNYSKFEVSF